MTDIVADLHVHTLASDGLLSPRNVVIDGFNNKLSAIAITDHDTVDGLPEAMATARKLSIELIPGIEFSTEYEDKEIHILGYFINPENLQLKKLLESLQQNRWVRTEKMVKKLVSLGYRIDLSEVIRYAGKAAPSRPHVARALVEAGYAKTINQVFDEVIGYQMPGWVERFKLSPKEAIEVVRNAGGVAAWAHPGLAQSDNLLETFIAAGLQGLEVYHPNHDFEQSCHYKTLAKMFNLFIVGGSDFHGEEANKVRQIGCYGLSAMEYRAFQDYYNKKKF